MFHCILLCNLDKVMRAFYPYGHLRNTLDQHKNSVQIFIAVACICLSAYKMRYHVKLRCQYTFCQCVCLWLLQDYNSGHTPSPSVARHTPLPRPSLQCRIATTHNKTSLCQGTRTTPRPLGNYRSFTPIVIPVVSA